MAVLEAIAAGRPWLGRAGHRSAAHLRGGRRLRRGGGRRRQVAPDRRPGLVRRLGWRPGTRRWRRLPRVLLVARPPHPLPANSPTHRSCWRSAPTTTGLLVRGPGRPAGLDGRRGGRLRPSSPGRGWPPATGRPGRGRSTPSPTGGSAARPGPRLASLRWLTPPCTQLAPAWSTAQLLGIYGLITRKADLIFALIMGVAAGGRGRPRRRSTPTTASTERITGGRGRSLGR